MNRITTLVATVGTLLYALFGATAIAEGATPISQVTKDQVGKSVTIAGSIATISEPRSDRAPYSMMIKDDTGKLHVVIWKDTYESVAGKDALKEGASVTATVKIQEYRGELEGTIGSANDLKVSGATATAAAPAVAIKPAAASEATNAGPASSAAPATKPAGAASSGASAAGGSISDITADKKDKTVSVSGTVQSFRASSNDRAPNSFQLKDASGSIRVAIWPDAFNAITGKDSIKDGAQVRVSAKVAEFRGALELHPDKATDVTVSGGGSSSSGESAPAAAATEAKPAAAAKPAAGKDGVSPISALTRDMLNATVTVSGKVASARAPSSDRAPYILKVTDSGGSVDVVFWSDTADKLSDTQKAEVGDPIRVTGKLNEFRGNLQLQPQDASGIQTQKSKPELFPRQETSGTSQPQAAAPAPAEVPLGQIATASASERVRVTGEIAAIEPVHAGRKLILKDGTGSANVLIWDNAEGLKPQIHSVHPASHVSLAGTIQDAQGVRYVVVSKPDDVFDAKP